MKEYGLILKLVGAIFAIMLLGDFVPESIQRLFFTLSLLMKDTLIFCMPVIVFTFIFSCLASFQKKAHLLIALVLAFVTLSNFIFIQVGYFGGSLFLPQLDASADSLAQEGIKSLEPYFMVPYPSLIRLDFALLLGMVGGLYGAFSGNEQLVTWGEWLKKKIQYGLVKIFVPLVPLYIIGFLFKIQSESPLSELFANYGSTFGVMIALQVFSVFLFFVNAHLGNLKNLKTSLKNVMPSGVVALSTMSSAATLPLTLEAAEKNCSNKSLAQLVIPATANIHHVGDSITAPVLMAAVLAIYGFEPISYAAFLGFTMYFMVAKYGVASVPGGEVILILPILQSQFGFTDSMIGLMTTLYMLAEPFLTLTNVLSNGALAIFMDKVCGRMKVFQPAG